MTETQAAQIELDKTAEELKRLHNERHQLYLQFEDCLKTFYKRNHQIDEESKLMIQLRDNKTLKEADVQKRKKHIQELVKQNKEVEIEEANLMRKLEAEREKKRNKEDELEDLSNNLMIKRNQLSAFATEQANRRMDLTQLNKALEEKLFWKKQDIERKKDAFELNLKKELNNEKVMTIGKQEIEEEYKKTKNAMEETEKLMKSKKDLYFKKSQELLKLREKQANLIREISSTLSARKNIDSQIRMLAQKVERQN